MPRVASNRYRVGKRLHHNHESNGSSWSSKTVQILSILVICWIGLLGYYWLTHQNTVSKTLREDYDLTKKYLEEAINVGKETKDQDSLFPSDTNGVVLPPIPVLVPLPPPRKKIAYAITVTKDGAFLDGALVLGYGIMKLHHQNGKTGSEYWDKFNLHDLDSRLNRGGQAGASMGFKPELSAYDAELVAFVTPAITHAKHILGK